MHVLTDTEKALGGSYDVPAITSLALSMLRSYFQNYKLKAKTP